MRKIARTRNHPGIKQVILYESESGVYLFPCTSVEDGFAVGDEWYKTLEIAESVCREEYGITKRDWEMIPDPPEDCQHDWIASVRVVGSNIGNPRRGRLEKQVDGQWIEIERVDGKWVEKNNAIDTR